MPPIRFYSSDGQRSTRVECTPETTCRDVCQQFSCDFVTMQIGNFQFRQLSDDSRPLQIVEELSGMLSAADSQQVVEFAESSAFRHLLAFFLGRPRIRNSLSGGDVLSEPVLVRKGRLLPTWHNANAIFYNSTIRLQMRNNEDELIQMRRMRCDVFDSSKGRSLRLKAVDGSCFLLIFQRPLGLQAWLAKAQQVQRSRSVDLSDERLTLVPELLLAGDAAVDTLNLRRNSLTCRPPASPKTTPLGYVDDLSRVRTLVSLDLSANLLEQLPPALMRLANLRHLNVAANLLRSVPKDLVGLRKLHTLNLANNMLSELPDELALLSEQLRVVDLSFNFFEKVPKCIRELTNLDTWRFAGNCIESMHSTDAVRKMDLRRNVLQTVFRLDSSLVTHLDVRDNSMISTIHLTNLRFLQVIHCERLQLTSLYLNGESLTQLHADHNLLDTIVIMPLPTRLETLSISHNHFTQFPDWIADCERLRLLKLNNNRVHSLPERLFHSPSIECVHAHNNRLVWLPSTAPNPVLETLILHNNSLDSLPDGLWRHLTRLRQLNVSSNRLSELPAASEPTRVQILRAADNRLDSSVLATIVMHKSLRVLDLHANRLQSFEDSGVPGLQQLEELNLASNELKNLPRYLLELPALSTLTAHSNHLSTLPASPQAVLHSLDVSLNHLDLSPSWRPPLSVKHLDVCGNPGSLDIAAHVRVVNASVGLFQVGVSSSKGAKSRQCVAHRMLANNTLAMVDGGSNAYMTSSVCRFLERGADESLEATLTQCHLELGEEGERLGASALLLRLDENVRIAACGTISAALVGNRSRFLIDGRFEMDDEEYARLRTAHATVDEANRVNGLVGSTSLLGHFALFPIVLPRVVSQQVDLVDGIVVANAAVWSFLSLDDVHRIYAENPSPVACAKKIQDKLHSFDYGGNSCVIVIRRTRPSRRFEGDDEAPPLPTTLPPTI